MVRALSFHSRGMGSILGHGNKSLMPCGAAKKKREGERNQGFLSQIQDILEDLGGELISCCLDLLKLSCCQKGKYYLHTL